MSSITLLKYLASCGVASRRKCDSLLRSGNVSVNGAVESNPAKRISSRDEIRFNGVPVRPETRKYYIMLNKPRGYVCSSSDSHAGKLAIDLVGLDDARLFSAGRLDCDSEGLLIFTNDGRYAQKLTHPGNRIKKTYRVSLDRKLTEGDISRILSGIHDDGDFLKAEEIVGCGASCYFFVMREGKNREIRRLAGKTGRKIKRLQRISVGALDLGHLPPGQWRHLTEDDIVLSLKTD